ncbi:hypothetical protein ACWCP8_27300 [Streptomyces sp. NPDC002206]
MDRLSSIHASSPDKLRTTSNRATVRQFAIAGQARATSELPQPVIARLCQPACAQLPRTVTTRLRRRATARLCQPA